MMNPYSKCAVAIIVAMHCCLTCKAGEASDDLIKKATSDPSKKERVAAMLALSKVVEKHNVLKVSSALDHLFQDKDAEIREAAVMAIALHALRNKRPCPIAVVKALFDPDERVRENAVKYVDIPHEGFPPEALPLLLRALQHDDASVRSTIPLAIARMSDKNKAVIDALEKATKDKDRLVRNNAEVALWKLNNDWNRYVRHMLLNMAATEQTDEGVVKDQSPVEMRDRMARNLLGIGAAQRIHDLGKEDPERIALSLIQLLADKTPGVRKGAARCLGAITIDNANARRMIAKLDGVKELKKLLDDADESVRSEAATAIKRISE